MRQQSPPGVTAQSLFWPTIVTFAKLVFLAAFVLQVVLWPSPMTIIAICTFGAFEILNLLCGAYREGLPSVVEAFLKPGVILIRWRKHGDGSVYVLSVFLWLYFAMYLALFLNHELDIQPWATLWLPASVVGNVSLQSAAPPPFDVTSDVSKTMRKNPFVWEKHFSVAPPILAGTIPGAGPAGAPIVCPTPSAMVAGAGEAPRYACYLRAQTASPPSETDFAYTADRRDVPVPIPDALYNVDVLVTPPSGLLCKDLEVYRIVLDSDRNVVHGLDLPSSTVTTGHARAPLSAPFSPLFGSSDWALSFEHTFTQAQYKAQVAARCEANGGSLVFRLPARGTDIDLDSGRMSMDVLLVSIGAKVSLHAGWKSVEDGGRNDLSVPWLFTPWKQLEGSGSDSAQAWRESSSPTAIFFKFFIAATPVLYVWYYLTAEYQPLTRPRALRMGEPEDLGDDVLSAPQAHSQVSLLCLFALLPAALLFLSIGAWVPMAGSVICALAVNHSMRSKFSQKLVRPSLIFLAAACNSIQFAWLIAIIAQAGFSAFFYEGTLKQLYNLSNKFIVSESSSPTWTTIVLPCILTVNACIMLVGAMCVVLEAINAYYARPARDAAPQAEAFF